VLDKIAEENVKKPLRKTSYEKLDLRNRPIINSRNSYQSLEFGQTSGRTEATRNFEFSLGGNPPTALSEPSQPPPFEKNFYKLHPDTKDFSDVSQTHSYTCVLS